MHWNPNALSTDPKKYDVVNAAAQATVITVRCATEI